MSQLKLRIQEATKAAMKARDKPRLAALRLINSDIKRVEVDERKALDDREVLVVLTRMLKQRNDSRFQYRGAGRTTWRIRNSSRSTLSPGFMPVPLSESEIAARIEAAIAAVGASGMRDMGKVMARLRDDVQGRRGHGYRKRPGEKRGLARRHLVSRRHGRPNPPILH